MRVSWDDLSPYLPPAWAERLSFPLTPADARRVCDHLTGLLGAVVTYLPRCVVEPALLQPPSDPLQGSFRHGTLLLADVSGFTTISERLRRSRLGREGAEVVTTTVNRGFTALMSIAQHHGGDLLKFGGDALLFLFEGEGHATRGCQAAAEMQAAIAAGAAQAAPAEQRFSLNIAIGLATGSLFTATLGTPDCLEFALLGQALERVSRAQSLAEGGQVVLDEETCRAVEGFFSAVPLAGTDCHLLQWEGGADLSALTAAPVEVHPPSGDDLACIPWLLARLDALSPYLPPGLLRRLVPDPVSPGALDETRWVTVLFAAIPGMSGLVERLGPTRSVELTARLNSLFTTMRGCVERYEGVVNKVGAGPAGPHILALFGAPQAHEDDPTRAVLAALEIQAALQTAGADIPQGLEVGQGTGVTTGFVFAGNVGSPSRREYTVMGTEVNLAARLMSAAWAGQVLVADSTAHHVERRVLLRALPPLRLKGLTEAVVAYQAQALRASRTVDLSHYRVEPLADREPELAQLQAALERASAGHLQVVIVHGEAGVGKSRLIAEGAAMAQERGMSLLMGTALSYGRDIPYLPWTEILWGLFDIGEEDEAAARIEKVRAGMERVGAGEWTPVVGHVLGLPVADTPLTSSLTPRLRQQRFFDLTLSLLRHRAAGAGLVLVFEDANWADAASLALLDYAVRNLGDVPLLLFIAHRPQERLTGRWQGLAHCVDLPLGELPYAAVQEMTFNLLKTPPAPEPLCRLIAERSQGNPLFVEEMLRALLSSHALRREGERWVLAAELTAEEFPDTIHSLLQSRIDGLSETDRRVLQVAACIGQSFSLRILSAVYPYGDLDGTLAQRLERLTSLGLTLQEAGAPNPTYAFRHTLTREVAYEGLAYARRRELHRNIGHFIDRETAEGLAKPYDLLAYHFYRGQVWDKAVEYALRAGEHARREYANEAALAAFRRALEAAEEGDRCGLDCSAARLRAHEALGDLLAVVGEYDRALEHYAIARRLAEAEPPASNLPADLCRKTAEVYEKKSEYDTAFLWLRQGLEVLGCRESLSAARIYLLGAGLYRRQGRDEEAAGWCQRGMAIAQAVGGEEATLVQAHALYLLGGIAERLGDNLQARQYCQESLSLYNQVGDVEGAARAYNNLANVYFNLGDWPAATEAYRQALAIEERVGDVYGQGRVANNLGEVLLYQGDLSGAMTAYRRSLEIWQRLNVPYGVALLHNNLAAVLFRQGKWAEARAHLEESLARFQEIGAEDFLPELYRRLAEVDLGEARLQEALTHATASVEMARQHRMRLEEGIAARVVGEVRHRLREWEPALRELQDSLATLEALDVPYETARTLLSLARLYADLGQGEEARAAVARSVETFRRLGARLDMEEACGVERELAERERRL
jgi:class 3 adenylate cyclase/tetratricopeptide (TPR) repeat protein